ncbi:hypothetical protein Sgleb_60900 [Streptomyces glebosus]|uniref:Uncharacterized protein n=1 Tax=Streptomyces glebosus TaxID=249580 RepID=A0A640T2K8_9ACTN|nr:hypothetical protein Sgleb_60900 [Streptomyces glebosus]GHG46380.1 hypothetical protein GCM10010513_02100 [Streptomyces glebosus]
MEAADGEAEDMDIRVSWARGGSACGLRWETPRRNAVLRRGTPCGYAEVADGPREA